MGSSIRDNRTISRQSNGCDFFSQRFLAGQEGDPNSAYVIRSSPYFLRVAVRIHEVYRNVYDIE